MSADRTRVGVIFQGVPQYYQRDREEKRNGKFVAVPFFVVNTNEAATMSEAAAKTFITKLRSLGVQNAWIEDCKDGRRVEFKTEAAQSGKDTRTEVTASIDDVNDYIIKPANTPNGQKWFIHIDVPGITEPQVIYGDDPLGVLQRAEDMGFLKYAPLYKRPEPQEPAPTNSRVGFRRRPGDRHDS
jgi:hypothetical protein